jgi:O-antigen/teichoic acid export membrane protein
MEVALSLSLNSCDKQPLSLKKNMLFNTAGSLFYQGCLWLTTVLVVLLSSGYDASGILSFAMTIGNMYFAIATYNMRTYQVSDISNKYSQQNYVGFRLVTISIGFATMIPYTLIVSPDVMTMLTVLLYLLFKMDEEFCDVLYGVDQRGGRMDYIGISQTLRGFLLVAGFSVGMAALHSINLAIVLMFVMCLSITFVYDVPHARRLDKIQPKISREQTISLLRECLPVVLSSLFLGMVVSVARQYYGNVYGMDNLGKYAAVATPAVLIQAAARYLYAPTLVPLAEKWKENPQKEFMKSFKKILGTLTLSSLVMVLLLSLCGKPILLAVYGNNIAPYTYLFPYVLISTAAIAVIWFISDSLIICRNLQGLLVSNAVALGITLLIMMPFERLFGMNGINYVVIASMLIGIIVGLVYLHKNIQRLM